MSLQKILVIERDVTDNAKTVGHNAEFIGIAEMPINVHLLYCCISSGMRRLLQRIFSIPTDTLLIIFLKYSQELHDFCGFDVVPDASKFTRFRQDFLMDLQSMFDHMVDLTEPIWQKLDPHLASMTIFDTSGIEAWVTENNPKYANRIIKQLKAFAKANSLNKNYDPYKAAYGSIRALSIG